MYEEYFSATACPEPDFKYFSTFPASSMESTEIDSLTFYGDIPRGIGALPAIAVF
jgi:hypothetical protein